VQRKIGEWLALNANADVWIGTTDAGAVRYFSDLKTIDVMGLNTPEMNHPEDEFIRAHPVGLFVFMPAWFNPVGGDRLEVLFSASTAGYTVTGNRNMATQAVIGARSDTKQERVRVQFAGIRRFELDFLTDRGQRRPGASP
jgi:hypothetical protein